MENKRKAVVMMVLGVLGLVAGIAFWPRPLVWLANPVVQVPRPAVTPNPPPDAPPQSVPALKLDNDEATLDRVPLPPHRFLSDHDVLVAGGVVSPANTRATSAKPVPPQSNKSTPRPPAPQPEPPPQRESTPASGTNSISAQDYRGPNALVNAMRGDPQFKIDHDLAMAFLQGKETLGWLEANRNWLGDEIMILLCKGDPQQAFSDMKTVQENPDAPVVMRDYSVQHIAAIVGEQAIGREGADYIWQVLKANDPATLSTALVSLQRLSEDRPDLVTQAQVAQAAQSLLSHADLRTQITAKSILKGTR